MPYVEVKLAGRITKEQKKRIGEAIAKALEEIAGKPVAHTYVVIEEVERENWFVGGKLLSEN